MASSRVPSATWVPDRAEVIWIQYSPAAGAEIPDLHPMLVASTREFNQVKSFDWRTRGAKPHPWGGGWDDLLGDALAILDDICGPRPA